MYARMYAPRLLVPKPIAVFVSGTRLTVPKPMPMVMVAVVTVVVAVAAMVKW